MVIIAVGQTIAGLLIAVQLVRRRWEDLSLRAFAQKLTERISS
ncbi:MAG: hypothetical protein PUP91_36060 [Rhizonema sp. PD37]|nr:hypothetical protein [Rhizonema sp. PD37]